MSRFARHLSSGVVVTALFSLSAPSARAALPTPTAAQCTDPAYTRTATGRAHAAVADSAWRTSACLPVCQAATVTRDQCLGESFYGTICGHIEAAKHIEARTTRNAQTWLRSNTKCGARLLDEGYANRPVVRSTSTVLGADGQTAVANVARLSYARPHATVSALTHTLEGTMGRLAVEAALPKGAGAPPVQDPVLTRHLRWQSENDAGDHVIESCEEYAWARTHTVSQLEDQFALRSQSALARAGVLYESAQGVARPWAFGLALIANPAGELMTDAAGTTYRSPTDGVTTYRTSTLFGATRPKNTLVRLPVAADQPPEVMAVDLDAPLMPAVLSTGPEGMFAARTVSIHQIGLTDDTLLADVRAAAGRTHADTAAENKAFYDAAVASPVLADRQLKASRLKQEISVQMAERAQIVAGLASDLRVIYEDALNLLENSADEAAAIVLVEAVPERDPLAPLWNPLGEQLSLGSWAVNPSGLSQPTLRSGQSGLFGDPDMLNETAVALARDDARYSAAIAAAARRLLALDGAIQANLQAARTAGCFRNDTGAAKYQNACDWDAVSFVESVRGRYRIDRQGDYSQCVAHLGLGPIAQPTGPGGAWVATPGTALAEASADGFEYRSLLDRADGTCAYRNDVATLDADALFETGTEGLGDTCHRLDDLLEAGYAHQPSTLRRYMLCADARERQIEAAAEAALACGRASRDSLEAAGIGFDAEGGRIFQRGGQPNGAFGQSLDEGNDLFRVRYDLVNAWGIEGFVDAADVDSTDNTACGLTPHMHNSFSARASALGFDYDVLRAQTSVATTGSRDQRTIEARAADLFVMNQQVLVPTVQTTSATAFNVVQDRSPTQEGTIFDVSTTFVIGFVPVTVAGGIAGRLGLEYLVGGGHEGGCEAGSLRVRNALTPSAGVSAFAEASVNLLVVSAGIKGSLELLGLTLPMGGGIEAEGTSLAIDNRVEQILTALQGYLAAFVAVTFPLVPEVRYEMPLFSWEGIRDTQTLHADIDDAVSIVGLRALARDAN